MCHERVDFGNEIVFDGPIADKSDGTPTSAAQLA